MEIKNIEEIAQILTGKYDVNHSSSNGKFIFYTCAMKPFKSDTYSFEGDSIILPGNGANVGQVFFSENQKFEAYQRTYVINNIQANSKYVFLYFKNNWSKSLHNKQYGSATNYIRYGNIAKFRIPLPPLEDQIRIATVLTRAEKLIAKRKESIKALDELLKSTFLEMFGDPVRNEKGWKKIPSSKAVIAICAGNSYGGDEKENLEADELGVLKISAVTRGYFIPNEFKAVKKASISKELRFVKKGNFLFSRANTVELVAACCIVDADYPQLFLPDKLWLLSFNHGIIAPIYFNFLLKNQNYRNLIRKMASGGHDSMLNVSMKKFLTLNVPVPPLPLQSQFATIVEKIESLKSKYTQDLIELEKLYGSLSQQAFKGELNLSRVPL